MKKLIALLIIIILAFSLLAACGGEPAQPMTVMSLTTNADSDGSSDSGGSSSGGAPTADADEIVIDADEEDADAIVIDADEVDPEDEIEVELLDFDFRNWVLDATIEQTEAFEDVAVRAKGMYANYYFHIKMTNGSNDMERDYGSWVESTMRIETDELADRLLSEILGQEVSGMGLGATVELEGKFTSLIPYYLDDNGYPVTPEIDEGGNYIWPAGKEQNTTINIYMNEISKNFVSPIRDKNGQTVQPPAGSYLLYHSFKMEFIGETYHALVGSGAEDVVYDIDLYVVIETPAGGFIFADHDYAAKVYMDLTTTEHHSVWLEGEGTFSLKDDR